MKLDPDQREWLYKEEQERLRWKHKLQRQPSHRSKWIPAILAGAILLVILAAIVMSDSFSELVRISR